MKAGELVRITLLCIDDDSELCVRLGNFLACFGFELHCESDGRLGLEKALTYAYDAIILEQMLQGLDGFEVLRRLRMTSQVPVITLAARSAAQHRVRGLDLGADDYLGKPFDAKELVARLRAIFRRVKLQPAQATAMRASMPEHLTLGHFRVIPGSKDAFYAGKHLRLTAMECGILETLIRNAGRVVSRDQMCELLYGRPSSPFDRSVDRHVSRLRRKTGLGRHTILSVRGTGYQLCYSIRSDQELGNAV